jgi:dipeptidyl aminopeptidase/acylaminoacyl peptidase
VRAALLVCLLAGTAAAEPREVTLQVGADPKLPLGATLTLPEGPGPFPAVVLVHGSGPSDRDETVGATHMFADLAAGLAARGIAVLRYDKRTFTYGDRLTNDLTLDDEVIADAVDAVYTLAARREIDGSRIVVVGHSLGGMLAPEIATRAGHVAGVAMLAPPARPPLDILRDQLRYLDAPADLRGAVEQAAIVDALPLPPTEPLYVLGMPMTYWRDWEQHDGIAAAHALTAPILVIQGGRDYQVTADDFALWKKGAPHATFVWLPADNHALIPGHGRPGPRDYAHAGHVDPRAIAKLAAFVSGLPRRAPAASVARHPPAAIAGS